MLKSDIMFLAVTIYTAVFINVYNSSMLLRDLSAPILALGMALFCSISMVFCKYLEKKQYLKMKEDIIEFNKQLGGRLRRGNRNNNR